MIKKINNSFLKKVFSLLLIVSGLLLPSFVKAQCCNYHLSMHDSYGDGWDGGYVEVYINNILEGSHRATNNGTVDSFQVCTGDQVRLVYTSGAYEEENSYQLYDHAYNIIYTNGPTPSTGTVFENTADCAVTAVAGNSPCNAIPIDTVSCTLYNNTGFSHSGLIAGCANNTGAEMWFQVTVPSTGNLRINTDIGTIFDTGLGIWTGNNCTNIQPIDCDDDNGPANFSSVYLYDLTPGQKLYIQVWGYNGAVGSFKLCAKALPKLNVDSSKLPIVMINTLGQTIVQDDKINGLMQIKYNGPGRFTHLSDSSNIYNGNIGIEIRGASSAGYPQTPYSFETRTATGENNNVSILGMPAENDWVLISNYNDRSLIRNTLANRMFSQMGNYSSRSNLCIVFVDSIYKGIYVLGEKLKRDKNRIDISKLQTTENSGDEVTGGYILQQNLWNVDNSFQSNYSPIDHPGFDVHYLYEYPEVDSITPEQKTYIASYIDTLETALYSNNFKDVTKGYRKYLDTKSFIDYFLVNEVSRNVDGFKKSVFFNKNKNSNGGKLKAGPVWDFDWAWKDLNGCATTQSSSGAGWAYLVNNCVTDNHSNGYYVRLLQDELFANELRCVYDSYRRTILNTTTIFSYIDSMKNAVQFDQAPHFQRWNTLGTSGPAPEMNVIAITYNAELDTLKSWINRRLIWLDANIPGNCSNGIALNETAAFKPLFYFPNPSVGNIHFEGTLAGKNPYQLRLYDITGRLLDKKDLGLGIVSFDYKLIKTGIYYFTVVTKLKTVQHGKLIVR